MKKVLLAGVALGLLGGPAMADIKIGVAGPMTGQYASFGAQMQGGAEQAVADINEAGGINGEKLVLTVGDDACDPKQAVAVANQAAGEGVVFMAGHFCSGSSIRPAPTTAVDDRTAAINRSVTPASSFLAAASGSAGNRNGARSRVAAVPTPVSHSRVTA